MPLSQEQLYGATATNKQKKSEDTGFFTSAAAGIASGLIKIPQGIVSIGAELLDLGLGTKQAESVEKFFDDLNPFDEVAEARTIGKITEALASIGPVAVKGAQIGIQAASKIRAANIAKRALTAKRAGNAVSLSKFGQIIHKGEDILTSPIAGGVIGSGIGESIVADEDIGTLADMLKGTSLEPFAITMMNTEEKEGRAEAFRRITNRIKFGAEGALFNLGITGAGKGVKKLREPATYGLTRWAEGGIAEEIERYLTFGFKASSTGTQGGLEAKRTSLDFIQAAKIEADTEVARLYKAVKDVVPKLDEAVGAEPKILNEIQDLLQPLPGKKLESIKLDELPNLIEKKSGIKNNARDSFKYEYSGIGDNQTRKLITPEKIVGEQGQKGFFSAEDYEIVDKGKAFKFLEKIQKTGGLKAKEDFKRILINMRSTIDNLTGKISQKNLKVEMSEKLHAELGNYLTADYAAFNESSIPLFRVNRNVAKIKEPALRSYIEQEKNAYKIVEAGKQKVDPSKIQVPQAKIDKFTEEGTLKIKKLLEAKNIDEIDPLTKNLLDETTGKPIDAATAKTEKDAITVQTSVLKRKHLDEWQEIVLGRIKDPKHTFTNSVSKMASLNYTIDYMENINRQGSKTSNRIIVDKGITKFIDKTGKEIDLNKLAQENIDSGKIQQKFYNNEGKYYTPEETFNIAKKETEDLLKEEIDRSKYIFGKGDAPGSTANAAEDLVASGKAPNIEEADNMLKDLKQFKQVKSTGVDGLSPLDGKWIRAPIYESLFDTTNQFLNTSKLGVLYKYAVVAPKTISQISKTVLNALTHVRNFISAGAFVSANGAIIPTGGDFTALLPTSLGGKILETGKMKKGLIESARRASAYRLNPKVDPAAADLVARSSRVGVGGGTQVQVSEKNKTQIDFFKDTYTNPAATESKVFRKIIEGKDLLTKGYKFTEKLYVEEDTFHKNINWLLERNRFDTAFKEIGINETNFKQALKGENVSKDVSNFLNKSVERFYDSATKTFDGNYELFLDEIGGKLTRNNVPNYAYVGRFGQAVRLSPFGNFIAFPLEVMRSGSNIIDQSILEMTSKIPAIEKLGRKRFASFALTVGGIPKIYQQSMMAIHDVSEEEMEALRKIVPEWSRNSTLVPTGRDKDGYLKYVDFSYSNAYDFLMRPINAVYNSINEGQNDSVSLKASLGKGLQEGTRELLEPFASQSLITEAVVDSVIKGGVGKNGRRIWSEQDEPFEKIIKGVGHIAKSVIPMQSTFKQMERLAKSVTGETGDYGEEFKLSDELPGLWGFRSVQANPERSLQFKLGKFGSNLKKTENLFTSPLLKGGRVTPQDILEKYQYSEARRFQVLKQMAKDVDAMRDLGVPDYKIRKKLKARKGLNKEVISSLMSGVYTPKKPGDFFTTRMGEINRDLNRKEGVSVPNPYFQALPSINQIINKNRRINLLDGDISFSQLSIQPSRSKPRSVSNSNSVINSQITGVPISPNNFAQQANNNYNSLSTIEKINAFKPQR